MRIATGEIKEGVPADTGKDPAAVYMGKRGGAARAKSITPERRAEIAKAAAGVHKSFRVSPAMAAGISNRLWSMEDLAVLVETADATPDKRGAYRKAAV